MHALAYTGGIVGTLLALAAVVLAVRAGGHSVGWGFQFQEPLFVAAVCAVLVAFALNLFGVFNVGMDGTALAGKVDASHGLARSAGEGMLAVVLATPCSAPLLGTAVGFAFAAGPGTVLAIFTALGLGLALPFCVLVLVPGLAKRLPRPGAWMERFKQLLGFALLGTCVWLVWVMGGLAGVDGMARLLTFLVAVALGAWVYGLSQGAEGARRWGGVAAAVLVLVGTGGFALRFDETAPMARASPRWRRSRGTRPRWPPRSRRGSPCSSTSPRTGASPASSTSAPCWRASRCAPPSPATRWPSSWRTGRGATRASPPSWPSTAAPECPCT